MTLLNARTLAVMAVIGALSYWAMAESPAAAVEEKVDKMKGRLETLFVWRVADKLSLTPNEETGFSKVYKETAQKRQKLSQKLEQILDQMEPAKTDKELDKLLAEYKNTLKSYNECQTSEFDALRKIFNVKKLSQYMLVKRDMTRRFRDVLSSGTAQASSRGATLKEPEVFQEK